MSFLLLGLVAYEIKNYSVSKSAGEVSNLRFAMRSSLGRHQRQRGRALWALLCFLAACVLVNGGIEDFFVRQQPDQLPLAAGDHCPSRTACDDHFVGAHRHRRATSDRSSCSAGHCRPF